MSYTKIIVYLFCGVIMMSQSLLAQDCINPIIVEAPGNNLKELIISSPSGTCFYFPNGQYSFGDTNPKDSMIFHGESRSGVRINGDGYENAFHGNSVAVVIRNMTLHNFNSNAGQYVQEQAPIRGADSIWAKPTDTLASHWVIDNIESHNNIASGLFAGDYFIIRNSIFRNNGITGIAGDDVDGVQIYNNTIYNNGANQAGGAAVNGGGIKLTKAGSASAPIQIRNNTVYENNRIGIWGDVACHYWEITGNLVSNHLGHGIVYEVSDHALIEDNILVDNAISYNGLPENLSMGGITVAESAFVEVNNNSVSGSKGGIVVRQTQRPGECIPDEFCEETYFNQFIGEITLVTSNAIISNNTINGAESVGVGNAGSGLGILTDTSNIQFICNTYDNPDDIDFYWIDGAEFNYSQWKAAGRDVCPPVSNEEAICKRSHEVILDGLDNEWGLDKYVLNNIILGVIDSEEDLAADFEISWDDSFLYIYATIIDDTLVDNSPKPWEADGLEIYIDAGNEKSTNYDDNDHQLIVKLTEPDTVFYHSNGSINPFGVDYALNTLSGFVTVEIRIDLHNFLDLQSSLGAHIGIDIHVNDADRQGLRETKLSWSAASDDAWHNPSLFGTVVLDDKLCHILNCQDSIIVINPTDSMTYHAATHLSSSAIILSGASIDFKAGETIELNTQFTVEQGAIFLAEIQSCHL